MVEERRGSHRVRMSGVRVTYESAAGDRVETDATDLSGGGLFIRTAAPLAVGKRISLDIQVIGEPGPWSVLGRVVWTRPKGEGDLAPPGMGVKLIDADDAVLAALEHLVEMRERTEPGVGKPSTPPPAAPAPVVAVGPERERTLLGVGSEEGTPAAPLGREQSVAIDLVTPRDREKESAGSAAAPAPAPALPVAPVAGKPAAPPKPSPKPAEGGGGGRWVVVLLLLIVAGVAAYVLLDGFLAPPPR